MQSPSDVISGVEPLLSSPFNPFVYKACERLSHVSPVEQLPYHCGKYQEANSIIHWYCHSLALDISPSGLRDSGGCEAKEMRAAQGGMAASCSATLSSCEKKREKGVSEESSFLTHFTESRHTKIVRQQRNYLPLQSISALRWCVRPWLEHLHRLIKVII